jgi:hypothetical protein
MPTTSSISGRELVRGRPQAVLQRLVAVVFSLGAIHCMGALGRGQTV